MKLKKMQPIPKVPILQSSKRNANQNKKYKNAKIQNLYFQYGSRISKYEWAKMT
jgi:hypothetical protein